MLQGIFNKNMTFKPKKKHKPGSKRYELHKYAKVTLGSGNLKNAVMLPKNEELNEWMAANTVDFFNQVSLLYGAVTEFCTPKTCPIMSAGEKYEYLWADDKSPKPVALSAPDYVDKLMSWVQAQMDDATVFPETIDDPFPKTFITTVKNIFRKLFRVYAHIYYSHFNKIVSLGVEAHLNTCFKHFYYFVKEFDLVTDKEMEPLKDLIVNLFSDSK